MTTLEQAARQALEALQLCANGEDDTMLTRDTLAALRQALEQNQFDPDWDVMAVMVKEQQRMAKRIEELEAATPLYTEPPKREWVGLTDEEIQQGLKETWVTEQAWQSAVWWAEQKLKELNA